MLNCDRPPQGRTRSPRPASLVRARRAPRDSLTRRATRRHLPPVQRELQSAPMRQAARSATMRAPPAPPVERDSRRTVLRARCRGRPRPKAAQHRQRPACLVRARRAPRDSLTRRAARRHLPPVLRELQRAPMRQAATSATMRAPPAPPLERDSHRTVLRARCRGRPRPTTAQHRQRPAWAALQAALLQCRQASSQWAATVRHRQPRLRKPSPPAPTRP